MPTPTYDLIEEKVLGSAQASVTFSSIPGTYKDLVLEIVSRSDLASGSPSGDVRFNSDSASNYSWTQLVGDGSAASSGRSTSQTSFGAFNFPSAANSGVLGVNSMHIMSYANTSVNKTALVRSDSSSNYAIARVGLWRSTSAITQIQITMGSSSNFVSGSTFRLWGVSG